MKNVKEIIYEVFGCDENSEIFLNENNGYMYVDFVSQGILCMTLDVPQIIDKCKRWSLNNGYLLNYCININPKTYTHILKIENFKNKETKIYDKELNEIDLDLEYQFIFLGCKFIIDKLNKEV